MLIGQHPGATPSTSSSRGVNPDRARLRDLRDALACVQTGVVNSVSCLDRVRALALLRVVAENGPAGVASRAAGRDGQR